MKRVKREIIGSVVSVLPHLDAIDVKMVVVVVLLLLLLLLSTVNRDSAQRSILLHIFRIFSHNALWPIYRACCTQM